MVPTSPLPSPPQPDILASLCEGLASSEPLSPFSGGPASQPPSPALSAAIPQAGYVVGSSSGFMEPANELSSNFSDLTCVPSLVPSAPSCPTMEDLVADAGWLSDAELDKLLQSCTVPEAYSDSSSQAASWDLDQLLPLDLSLCV